jgi:hypothetical protein
MIGSRYFTKRPKSLLSASTGSGVASKAPTGASELNISVSVLEGWCSPYKRLAASLYLSKRVVASPGAAS